MCDEVVVTGAGVLTSVGSGVEAFSDALSCGRVGITSSPEDGFGVAGRLPEFNFENSLARLSLSESVTSRAIRAGRRAPRSAQVSLITAQQKPRAVPAHCAYRRKSCLPAKEPHPNAHYGS